MILIAGWDVDVEDDLTCNDEDLESTAVGANDVEGRHLRTDAVEDFSRKKLECMFKLLSPCRLHLRVCLRTYKLREGVEGK